MEWLDEGILMFETDVKSWCLRGESDEEMDSFGLKNDAQSKGYL